MKHCIVIPFYNEVNRFQPNSFLHFLEKHPEVELCCVDDGSSDNTLESLVKFQKNNPGQIHILPLQKNEGKGNAVRKGILWALDKYYDQFAFMDADLSTPFEESWRLSQQLNPTTYFVFGSRIKKIDNTIERKWYRFLIGRLMATLISKMLCLPVYDTQCGCKWFDRKFAAVAFADPFLSQWLFDVEIFFRLKNYFGEMVFKKAALESPLLYWKDEGDSRIAPSYALKVWKDLFLINRTYKNFTHEVQSKSLL